MNSLSSRESICDLMALASPPHVQMLKSNPRLTGSFTFHTEATIISTGKLGTVKMTFVMRIRIASIIPPCSPASIPIKIATPVVKIAARKAVRSTSLEPWTICWKGSLPTWSVPSGCSGDGHWNLFAKLWVVSRGTTSGPTVAISTKMTRMIRPMKALLFRLMMINGSEIERYSLMGIAATLITHSSNLMRGSSLE